MSFVQFGVVSVEGQFTVDIHNVAGNYRDVAFSYTYSDDINRYQNAVACRNVYKANGLGYFKCQIGQVLVQLLMKVLVVIDTRQVVLNLSRLVLTTCGRLPHA